MTRAPWARWAMALLGAGTVACAGRVTPLPADPGPAPEVSWRIWRGGFGGDRAIVCTSEVDAPCVLDAAGAGGPRGGALSVFLHPGRGDTVFSGSIVAGFIDGADGAPGYELTVDEYGVETGAAPPMVAVVGVIAARPGTYAVTIALEADMENRQPQVISLAIPVRIVAPGA